MNNALTVYQLRQVILQQGIVGASRIVAEADFRRDLQYKTSDLLELARLIDKQLHIRLTVEQVTEFTEIGKAVDFLNQLVYQSA